MHSPIHVRKIYPTHVTRIYAALLLAAAAIASGCNRARSTDGSSPAKPIQGEKSIVYVTNYPLQYFAERIGGELIEVHFPAPRDIDPAFWKPGPETINDYQQADLILLNGAGYEKWVATATLPESKVVNTSATVKHQYITVADSITHSHGPTGEHSHAGIAFTTWLDPLIAVEQAKTVRDALKQVLPDSNSTLEGSFSRLEKDLLDLDRQLQSLVSKNPSVALFSSHPVYQYLARRYGLNLESVHWEPDELPNANAWAEFDELVSRRPAKWMIWEEQPMAETMKRLQLKGIKSVVFAPCGNTPEDGDYFSVMQQNVESLHRVFLNNE